MSLIQACYDFVVPSQRHDPQGADFRRVIDPDLEYTRRSNQAGWQFDEPEPDNVVGIELPKTAFNPRKVYDEIKRRSNTIGDLQRQIDDLERDKADNIKKRTQLLETWLKETDRLGAFKLMGIEAQLSATPPTAPPAIPTSEE